MPAEDLSDERLLTRSISARIPEDSTRPIPIGVGLARLGRVDLFAAAAATLAGIALVGWAAAVPVLVSPFHVGPVMKANTALALVALSFASLVARRATASNAPRVIAMLLAAFPVAIVGATAYEYLSGVSLGIDELIARDLSHAAGTPGRMAIGSIVALLLMGVAIMCLDWAPRGVRISEWIACGAATIALLALIGGLFRVDQLTGLAGQSRMSGNTAIALLLVFLAVVTSRREHVIFRMVAGSDAGASFLRRFGLAAFAVPLAIGASILGAGRAGTFGFEFAISLGTFVAMAFMAIGLVSTARYIRHAEAEGRGRREAEVYRLIVETANEGVWTTDEHGRTLFMNQRMLEMLGYEAAELIGQPALDLAPGDVRNRQQTRMQERFSGSRETYETTFVRKDGSILWCLVGATPRLNEDGRPAGSLALVSDITARRAAEEALESARSQAVEASRLKSEFLANMSHEIRTPMNGVLGMTELLRATSLNEEQAGYAEAINRSGEALMTIINDILDFSKIEAGRLDIETIDFDVRLVVEEVAELMAAGAQEKGLELAVMIRPGMPESVRGDPVRLRQVLLNLIGNAVKFTEHGEVVVSAQSALLSDGTTSVGFEVGDTGPGLSEATQKRLFQSFTQADASTTRRFGGTGLGLAICRQLVELMGGEIGVRSTVGKGSTFFFNCVFGQSSPAEADSGNALIDLSGTRILAVDDNHTNRAILVEALRSWRIEVESCGHGSAALELLSQAAIAGNPYDLVILDMQMPEMDGIEVARRIRNDLAMVGVRLILLTSSGQRGAARVARDAGIEAFLTKPVKLAALRDCLATVLGRASTLPVAKLVTTYSMAEAKAGQRPLVLVVDDNPVNQRVALGMLGKLGYRVDVAGNGLEAVAAATTHRYAAILMDCQMPEMDGYAATREIRTREGTDRHTPIIAMTAAAMKSDEERCTAAGMDGYVSKPMTMEQVGVILGRWTSVTTAPTKREPPQSSLEPIDSAMLAAHRDLGDEYFSSLVEIFVEDTRLRINQLRSASREKDWAAMCEVAHSLKGSSGNFGALRLSKLCAELELLPAGGLDVTEPLTDAISAEFERAVRMLGADLGRTSKT